MDKLERLVEATRAHDCTNGCCFGSERCKPGNGGFHGIGSVNMSFVVKGEQGAYSFTVLTGWYWDETHERMRGRDYINHSMGGSVDYHSKIATECGYHSKDCMWTGGDCWCDGSGLAGANMFELLAREGLDAVWQKLETRYHEQFNG